MVLTMMSSPSRSWVSVMINGGENRKACSPTGLEIKPLFFNSLHNLLTSDMVSKKKKNYFQKIYHERVY